MLPHVGRWELEPGVTVNVETVVGIGRVFLELFGEERIFETEGLFNQTTYNVR